jgi:hypothetical protein
MSDPDTWHFLPKLIFGLEGMAHPVSRNTSAIIIVVFICSNYNTLLEFVKK